MTPNKQQPILPVAVDAYEQPLVTHQHQMMIRNIKIFDRNCIENVNR